MARRYIGNINGERYLGSIITLEVHDLEKEDSSLNGCQIDKIINEGYYMPFNSLQSAHELGFDNCAKCVVQPTR